MKFSFFIFRVFFINLIYTLLFHFQYLFFLFKRKIRILKQFIKYINLYIIFGHRTKTPF